MSTLIFVFSVFLVVNYCIACPGLISLTDGDCVVI